MKLPLLILSLTIWLTWPQHANAQTKKVVVTQNALEAI